MDKRRITCKKCHKPGQHGGRGLCPSCYYHEDQANRLETWPKQRRSELAAITIPAPKLVAPPRPRGSNGGAEVTIRFEGPALQLWERITTQAREEWRTPELQILSVLSRASAGTP